MQPIRVLIVDDSVFMRTVLRDLVARDPALHVVGTATDGRDAIRKVAELSPDIVTLDIEMPEMNGLEALRHIVARADPPRVLMLSSLTGQGAEMTRNALSLGADDFMLKPTNIGAVRGIEKELHAKLHDLIDIPLHGPRKDHTRGLADRVVLIGASAGGPPMLDRILSRLEPVPAAIIVTQHMPLGFTASLAERLNRVSLVPVKESENGEELLNETVYISRAGSHTVLTGMLHADGQLGGKILHSSAPPVHAVRPAVDITFSTGAKTFGKKVFSIILSGMGKDGGAGTADVKKYGGMTAVCNEADCLVYGMGRSALDTDCVDQVIPLDAMAGSICACVRKLGEAYG